MCHYLSFADDSGAAGRFVILFRALPAPAVTSVAMGVTANIQLIETVVFPGDTLHCKVDFCWTNDGKDGANIDPVRLNYADIQIYGQIIVDSSRLKVVKENLPPVAAEGLPKPGMSIFASSLYSTKLLHVSSLPAGFFFFFLFFFFCFFFCMLVSFAFALVF
jgi:hypothetical protein